ncbi:MAG TPA: NAD(P)H-hydrate dehydratase [Nitrolancea sp.]|nr:NAD(P)H-hydrate dehydratase [Nitrolancea sp.]
MIKLCTVDEVRAAERAAVRAGRSESDLMGFAAVGFAALLLERAGLDRGIAVFLIGPGRNGGDGLLAAAILAEEGWDCRIWTFDRDSIADPDLAASMPDSLTWLDDIAGLRRAIDVADIIIDAVFGTGGKTDLPAEVASAFDWAHQARVDHGTPLWAVDVPTGVNADTGEATDQAFKADVTVCIGLPKLGLYRVPGLRFAGEIEQVEIGLEAPTSSAADVELITEAAVRRLLPRRRQDTHKHDVGWLMVIGGAPNYFGAPRMSAEAAARAGAGMVCLAVPRSLVAPIASAVREVTFLPLPDAEFGGAGDRMAKLVKERLPEFAALLVGPGLGQDDPIPDFLSRLFGLQESSRSIGFGSTAAQAETESFRGRAVVDADGLNWLAKQDGWHESLRDAELVLTPHPGELSRLTGMSTEAITGNPWDAARNAAEKFQQVVVLKHAFAVVAAPGKPLLIGPRSQPALASAGTGDVLAGVIAGLMAQGLAPRDAAAAGLFIGSRAADFAVASVGTLSLVAGDVIEALPLSIRALYDRNW